MGQINVEALGRHMRAAELVPKRSARRHLERHTSACPLMMVVESADNDMGGVARREDCEFPPSIPYDSQACLPLCRSFS